MHLFGMVTTGASARYTPLALDTFFAETPMAADDRFVLIDNDANFDGALERWPMVELVRNTIAASFAVNVNYLMRRAEATGADLVVLNNDLVFTRNWFPPLAAARDVVSLPGCNQTFVYSEGELVLKNWMDFEEFAGRHKELAIIVERHQARELGYRRHTHMAFFCVRIPLAVVRRVGPFDDSFGKAGAEDIDYFVRCHLAGIDVVFALQSYLLHFGGKSTWRGGETSSDTIERRRIYETAFARKWGVDLQRLLIGHDRGVLVRHGLEPLDKASDVRGIVLALLSRRLAV